MKKIVVILLMLIYGAASVGATVHFHYCMNEYVGWSLLNDNDDQCGKCGMDEEGKDSCCKDEHKHFKLKTDHQKAGQSLQHINFLSAAIAIKNFSLNLNVAFKTADDHSYFYPPPDIGTTRLHLQNCIFRI